MCFSPQRRTIFRHLNFQKWSRTLSFLTFLLPNVLFATAACNFWCHLSAPTSAPAALTGLLLDWPDTRIYEKTQHFVTSLTFGAHVSSFLLTFWLLHLLSTDLTTLLLLFNSPYCRKFLFKLPSITIYARIMIPWWRRARWWFIMRGISFTFQIEFVIIRHQDLTKLLPELDLSFFFFAVLPFCRTTLTSCWSIFLQATVARPAACGFVLHREAFSPLLRLLLLLRPLFLFFLIYFFSSCLSVLLFLWLRILLWLAVLRLFKLVIGPA